MMGTCESSAGPGQTSLLVIGVGNPYRSDDGAGPRVAEGVRDRLPSRVKALKVTGDLLGLPDLWRDAEAVILVDAACSGASPGTLHRFQAGQQPVPSYGTSCSSHALDLGQVIDLSRALGSLPPDVSVYAIEGGSFEAGEGLSPEVADAVDSLVETIVAQVAVREAGRLSTEATNA